MRVSMPTSSLVLLIGSSTILAFSPSLRPFSLCRVSRTSASPSSLPPRRHHSFLQAISDKLQAVSEAKQCLMDIESSVQTARSYLKYLEDVAQVVKAYVEGTEPPSIDTSGRPPLPELKDASAAKDYLSNLTKAYSAAEEYLNYLEGVAASVREYLNKWESSTEEEARQEAKTRGILSDLEETAHAAKKYLVYLKGVASAVEQYLADPSRPPPPELANLESVQVPSASASLPPSLESPFPTATTAPSAYGGPSYVDRLASTENAQPPPVNGAGTGNYLDNISSAASSTKSSASTGDGVQSFADSISSTVATPASAPTPAAKNEPPDEPMASDSAGSKRISISTAVTSDREYIGNMSSSSVKGGSTQRSYLDSIKSSSSALRGSGTAQKRYTDNLRASPTTPKANNAPSGYLESLEKSKGTTVSDSTGVENGMGAALSVFLSLLFLSAAAVFQWYNTDPAAVEEFLRSANVNIPIEKTLSRPRIIEQLTTPSSPPGPELRIEGEPQLEQQAPPGVVSEAPLPPKTVHPEDSPISPSTDPEFDDWEF